MKQNSQIYVIGLNMENHSVEEIAREAALRIDSLFEQLIKEQKQEEEMDHEGIGHS